MRLVVGDSYPEIPDNRLGPQLALLEDVSDVLADGTNVLQEQVGHCIDPERSCEVGHPVHVTSGSGLRSVCALASHALVSAARIGSCGMEQPPFSHDGAGQ